MARESIWKEDTPEEIKREYERDMKAIYAQPNVS
jgi:hypothetical protein